MPDPGNELATEIGNARIIGVQHVNDDELGWSHRICARVRVGSKNKPMDHRVNPAVIAVRVNFGSGHNVPVVGHPSVVPPPNNFGGVAGIVVDELQFSGRRQRQWWSTPSKLRSQPKTCQESQNEQGPFYLHVIISILVCCGRAATLEIAVAKEDLSIPALVLESVPAPVPGPGIGLPWHCHR